MMEVVVMMVVMTMMVVMMVLINMMMLCLGSWSGIYRILQVAAAAAMSR